MAATRRTNKSEQAPAMPKYLGVFVTENYQGNDGEEKTSYTRVGAAFPHRKGCGFNIEITEGISVSGQLVALPRVRARRARPAEPSASMPRRPKGGQRCPPFLFSAARLLPPRPPRGPTLGRRDHHLQASPSPRASASEYTVASPSSPVRGQA